MKILNIYFKKNYIISISLWLCIIILLYYSKSCFAVTIEAIRLFSNTLLPAVFLFIFITHFLIKSSLIDYLSLGTGKLISKIFGVSTISSTAFLIGSIFGYPSGITYSTHLLEEKYISKEEYTKLILFTNNPSITYIVSSIGIGIFGNIWLGIVLFTSITISNILIGVFYRPDFNNIIIQQTGTMSNSFKKKRPRFLDILFDSIKQTFYSISLILFFTILFSIIANLICNMFNLNYFESSVVFGFLEITQGIKMIFNSLIPFNNKLLIISFFLGFSSFMVILQLFAVCYKHIKFKMLLFAKLLQGILSTITCYLLITLFNINPLAETFSNTLDNANIISSKGSFSLFIYMATILTIFLIIIYKKRLTKSQP